MNPRLAVLMASHNRREKTAACVRGLLAQVDSGVDVRLYLVDDGSSDGTAEAVIAAMPATTVIRGDGSLFWAAAMAVAESRALLDQPDYLLWLNDDTLLDADGLSRLVSASRAYPDALIVGSTRDPFTGERTYGGRSRYGWHPQRFRDLPISCDYQVADTFNGNVALVPLTVQQRVGTIDGAFPHAYADDDYGLRATAKGIRVLQIPGTIGTCESHPPILDRSLGLISRWRMLESPRGLPFRAQYRFLRRHGGPLWPLLLVGGYAKRLFFPR